MKGLRSLERILYGLETFHLALMSWCLSLPLLFFFPSGSYTAMLLWGLGAALPVLGIRELALRIQKPWIRLAVGLAVTLTAAAIPRGMVGLTYLICGVLYSLVGAFFPRPDGKLILTVPKFYHALFILLTYAFGMICQVSLLIVTAVSIALLFTVNYLLHRHVSRLLTALREDLNATVSAQSIISLSRRVVLVFLAVGVVLILAVPWLLNRQPAEPVETEPPAQIVVTTEEMETEPETVPEDGNFRTVSGGIPWNFTLFEDSSLLLIALISISCVLLAGAAVLYVIGMLRDDKDKHSQGKQSSFVVEKLPEPERKAVQRDEPEDTTWQRRIRRQYHRSIDRRTKDRADRSAMTPSELEAAAQLPEGADLATLHTVYEKARYSDLPSTQEDYKRIHAAAKELSES